MTRNLSIWNDLRPFTIGFDDLFSQFDHYVDNRSNSFPPYNIVKGKDDLNWKIEMALAGYNKNDIEVKYADNTITIKSTHKDEDDKDTIHRGIAKRHFTRSFTTADDVEVRGAEMKDGMLSIALEKIVPEGKKPRTIDIA
jgi:molecular chaperone IbpA